MDEIGISNLAIGFVGGNQIMSFTDETLEAELCETFWEPARDFCLESRDWTFAAQYRQLDPSLTVTPSEFANNFLIPADCISVRIVSDSEDLKTPVEYQKDERNIWSDAGTLYIKYTKKVTNTALFSPTFVEAVATKLGEYISTGLTSDKVLRRSLRVEANESLEEGGSIDGMQGSPKRATASRLLQARNGSYAYGTRSRLYPWGY